MSVFAEDLRTYIAASTAINQYTSTRIHYAQLPQSSAHPHIWFRISSDTEERTMDGVGGLHECYIDLECVGLTQTSAQTVATALKDRLDGYAGTIGNASCKACFLRDKDDSYIPFSIQSDEGVVVIAFTGHAWYST